MGVIAKFFVQEVERHENTPTASHIKLGAVCRGKVNAGWASATPGGTIDLWVLNEAATAYFVEGAEYEIRFQRVEPPKLGDGHQPVPVTMNTAGDLMCQECGVYAKMVDGRPDWTAHAEHYGPDAKVGP